MDYLETNLRVEQVYAAVSANRHENIISCNKNYLLYSRSHCPVIHDLSKSKQVPTLFAGHTGEINGQCFVVDSFDPRRKDDGTWNHVISTAYDNSAIIWEFDRHEVYSSSACEIQYKILLTLKSPNNDVFTTRCAIRQGSRFVSVTSTIDGSIHVWVNDEVVQTINTEYTSFHSKLHTIRYGLDQEFVFLLLAGSDNRIHVFQLSVSVGKLYHVFDLLGHSDWIKDLDIVNLNGRHHEFLLAAAAQDSFIRVWHMKLVKGEGNVDACQVLTIVSKPLVVHCQYRLTATLETVLSGHEGIVHGLCWFKKKPEPELQLISCSADRTIVVWTSTIAPTDKQDEYQRVNRYEQSPASAEIWKEAFRLGETGETNLPFLGVCLSDDESTLYAHSLRGAIHSWCWESERWVSQPSITGHFEALTDLSWERTGAYLLSTSLDKTCRLHAIASSDNEWHEITRPQVHGHEINCLASISFSKFATGAEEKTIRTFEATQFFARNFKFLTKSSIPNELESVMGDLPVHAQLPALGLSNRGAMSPYDIGDPNDKTSSSNTWYGISPLVERLAQVEHLDTLPTEELLLQSTLWWETGKLFGHGNELHALAVDSQGTFLASASKANRSDLANILVWEASKFRKVATIEHHSLTVTRLKFSPDDKYLLSVSRDRTWCLSERTGQLRSAYKRLVGTSKTNAIHERIIWDCSWTFDSEYFVTVSRDKKAIIWSTETIVKSPEKIECQAMHQFDCSVQAVDSPNRQMFDSSYLFVFGLENGNLELHLISKTQWVPLKSIALLHHLPIRRLAFKPSGPEESELLLASGGDDCVVKLTKFLT